MSNRRDCAPIIVKDGKKIRQPERIPFDEHLFAEEWLQELLRANPEILPSGEIEPAFSPLVSIGREVPTAVGPIDNLFLSSEGYLCIVETKLWRNPQARREVVGQIIDYAKEISGWSFEDLEACVRAYNIKHEGVDRGVLDTLRQIDQIETQDEAILVDAVTKNLKRGRFLLLVVGDGIRESVEDMAAYLNQSPQLFFTLGLVELQVYQLADDEVLVIPQVVMRTQEVTRAIVRVEGQTVSAVSVDISDDATVKKTPKRSVLTQEDYFSILSQHVDADGVAFARQILTDMTSRGYFVEWLQGSYGVKLPDPQGSGKTISLFFVTTDGQVYIWFMGRKLRELGISEEIAWNFAKSSARLVQREVHPKEKDAWDQYIGLGTLKGCYKDFLNVLDNTVDAIQKG